jgi:chitinase
MTHKHIFGKSVVMLLLFVLSTCIAFAQAKVVGYMPSWAGQASAIQYTKLTHINYAFIRPTTTGGLTAIDQPAKLQDIVSRGHAAGVKVGIAIGGWSDLQNGDFQSMSGNATYRTNFVNNLVNLCNQYGLDGVDIDWEYPSSGADPGNFTTMMTQLASAMHSRGKYLSAAVAAYGSNADGIQSAVFNQVDFLNLMAYDGGLPNHSTYDYAVTTLNYWKGRGLAASKAVLGVPFYGRSSSEYVNYNDILLRGGSPDSDYFGSIGYNGRPTIRSKTTLGVQNGGIMIWDLSGDEGTGGNSLLTAIDGVVKGTPTGCTGSFQSVPGTIQAESFCQMSGIQTEATTDTGGGQNVGYIDAGDWMGYRINVPTTGTYTLSYRVASQAGGGSIRFEKLGGGTVFGTLAVPSTGGWQTWTTITQSVNLTAGQQDVALAAAAGGFNINWFSLSSTGNPQPNAPIGQTIWLRGGPSNWYVSSENGTTTMHCNRTSVQAWEQFTVVDAGAGKIALRGMSKYVSSQNGVGAMTCSSTAIGDWEKFDWVVNADGKISLRGNNGRYVSSENGTNAMTCNRTTIGGWEAFSYGTGTPTGRTATREEQNLLVEEGALLVPYPNPVKDKLTYPLPRDTKAHSLRVVNASGHEVMLAHYGDTGANNTIEVSEWKEGLYVIRIYNNKFQKTFKVFKK